MVRPCPYLGDDSHAVPARQLSATCNVNCPSSRSHQRPRRGRETQLPTSPPPPPGPIVQPSSSMQKPPDCTAQQHRPHPQPHVRAHIDDGDVFACAWDFLEPQLRPSLTRISTLRLPPASLYAPGSNASGFAAMAFSASPASSMLAVLSASTGVVSTTDRSRTRSCNINSTFIACSQLRMQAQSSQDLQGC